MAPADVKSPPLGTLNGGSWAKAGVRHASRKAPTHIEWTRTRTHRRTHAKRTKRTASRLIRSADVQRMQCCKPPITPRPTRDRRTQGALGARLEIPFRNSNDIARRNHYGRY